jgi:hypothetical protein
MVIAIWKRGGSSTRDLEVAETTLPISIWGVPLWKWAGTLGYSHTGNPRFQIEFVSIWGLTYTLYSQNSMLFLDVSGAKNRTTAIPSFTTGNVSIFR